MRLLAIESSCDETAAAVLESPLRVLSSVVASQIDAHRPFGGVVPELAARAHLDALPWVIHRAIEQAGVTWDSLDAVAYTRGPGLSSSLLAGAGAARAIARRLRVPAVPVHHLEGHILSLFLASNAPGPEAACPALILLATGGHTALIRMKAPGDYALLGRSVDDAAGEALDKGARLLGLPYPGGPEIERLAIGGQPGVSFSAGLPDSEEAQRRGGPFPFSFSGLKTALRYYLAAHPDADPASVARGYQEAVMGALIHRTRQALADQRDYRCLVCVGGVARNAVLSAGLRAAAAETGVPLLTVPPAFCTDNAAMIGAVALLRGISSGSDPGLVDPNWPLQGLVMR